jgi:hypothetical protein
MSSKSDDLTNGRYHFIVKLYRPNTPPFTSEGDKDKKYLGSPQEDRLVLPGGGFFRISRKDA